MSGGYHVPDEIILDILPHLTVIRKFLCKPRHELTAAESQQEDARRRENKQRMQTLAALCLSSRRLHNITNPFLYSAYIVGPPFINAQRSLLGLLRSITESPLLTKYIQYVENDLEYMDLGCWHFRGDYSRSDTIRRRISIGPVGDAVAQFYGSSESALSGTHDKESKRGLIARKLSLTKKRSTPVNALASWHEELNDFPEQALVALVIALAPNIEHLALVSIEHSAPSFWGYIGISGAQRTDQFHRFSKLQTLCVYVEHFKHDNSAFAWYHGFIRGCSKIASLNHLQAHGLSAMHGFDDSIDGGFKNLTTINITECDLLDAEIGQMIRGCEGLRHLTCAWSIPNCRALTGVQFEDLLPALVCHKSTLSHLHLDKSLFTHDTLYSARDLPPPIGDFYGLTSLKHLAISFELLVLLGQKPSSGRVRGTPWTADTRKRLPELLPASLETLFIIWSEKVEGLVERSHYRGTADVQYLGEYMADLVGDGRWLLPNLRLVQVMGDMWPKYISSYQQQLEDMGVELVWMKRAPFVEYSKSWE